MTERLLNGARLDQALLDVLRAATETPSLEFDGATTRLTGGFWAELVAFRLRHPPSGWPRDLVLRVMPDAGTAARETAIQAAVAAQGFPTPPVRLAGGPGDGLGRAFMVMDRAEGRPMLSGLGGARALAALPTLMRRLPVALAEAMAELHRIDPGPVRERAVAAGSLGIAEMLAYLEESAAACGRTDLAAAARSLAANPPAAAPDVVCHGDLHPFNLLVDEAGAVTVLDWSVARVAPAAFDVAFTNLLLIEPPIAVHPAVRPAVRAAGRLLARGFRRAYTRRSGVTVDARALQWHEGITCLRALAEVAGWVTSGEISERAGHPWLVSGPALATRLSRASGVRVASR